MLHKHVKKQKFNFSFGIVVLFAIMIVGIVFFKNINFQKDDYFKNAYIHFKYKVAIAKKCEGVSLASALVDTNKKCFLNKQSNRENAKSIPVLLYHGVLEKVDDSDTTNISYDNFSDQMIALKEKGWQTVKLEDFLLFSQGKKDLPEKSFLLTFDDGRRDTYYSVDPILKALDYSAVIFVITKHSFGDKKSNFYLSKKELQDMNESGRWGIEPHTDNGHDTYKIDQYGQQSHFYSNKIWLNDLNRLETDDEFAERVKVDLVSAKNDLEQGLGTRVLSFAFPFGDYGQQSKNFPKAQSIILDEVKSIYPVSFYQVEQSSGGSFNYPEPNQFLGKRISVNNTWNSDYLLKVLDAAKDKNISFTDNFSDYKGWIKTWGEISLKGNSMVLNANSSSTGSMVFLDGSHLWTDYFLKSNIDFVKGQTYSLIARYADDNNYISCVFTPEYLRIHQMESGQKTLALEKKGNFGFAGQNRIVGIKVEGNVVGCYVDDKMMLGAQDLGNTMPEHGGIGFGTWDPEVNNSEMIVREVSVE